MADQTGRSGDPSRWSIRRRDMGISKFRLAGIAACLLIWAVFASTPLDVPFAAAQEQTPDTTPPRLALPGSVTVEAISRLGVAVTYTATAVDDSGPPPSIVCNPASGSVFPLGSTTVACTATDAAGNSSSGSFPVTVRDITPPRLILPASFKTEASSRLGALVIFANSASDAVDPSPVVLCDPSSGTVFPLGATTVSCTGIDASGNVAGEHFIVTVEDTSRPRIVGRVSPPPNSNGWNNTDVAVTFSCSDTASGVVTCDGDATLVREGGRRSVGGIAVDRAGNIATATMSGINIDKTPPTVMIKSPAQGAEYLLSEPALTDWEVRDTLSGVGRSIGTAEPGLAIDTSSLGPHEFSLTATDRAGNSATVSNSYTVVSPFADFVVHKTEVGLEGGAPRDEFLVEGVFETGSFSNGISVPNEVVTVTFDGFTQTIPAASFARESNGLGFQYDGASGGVTRFIIRDDGQFLVKAEMLKLPGVGLEPPVRFSLSIGDDVGETTISLDDEGPFRLQTRQTLDFFGTVLSVGDGVLTAKTVSGIIKVPVTADTSIRLSHRPDAGPSDLIPGDLVAVSLGERDGRYYADKIVRVPLKTRNKHVPGEVVAITDTHITVASTVPAAAPVIFRRAQDTPVRFHRGESEVGVGAFVIIGAVRDPLTGLISAEAREINVIPELESIDKGIGGGPADGVESSNQAKIVGVLEEIDKDGNWVVNGASISIGASTRLDGGLTVGQTLQVHAELLPGGSLLARRIGRAANGQEVAGETKLEGVFEGIEPLTGDWMISGLPLKVGTTADTDGIPSLGQTIKVLARLEDDGSLSAREIENRLDSEYTQAGSAPLKLQGVFSEVDEQGNWEINGVKVAVDRSTRLAGSPALGRTIQSEAVRQGDASLLAQIIEGETLIELLPGNRAELRGFIEEIFDDGSMVIQGILIERSILTETEGIPQIGDFVQAEILIRKDGTLLAIGIEPKDETIESEFPRSSPVNIRGVIDRVNPDLSLVVNGIAVAISPLTDVKGTPVSGASVDLEGLFNTDGSITARRLAVRGRRATLGGVEATIDGLIEEMIRDRSGKSGAITVSGVSISLDTLTQVKGNLAEGTRISAKAIIADGTFVAREIEELKQSTDLPPAGQFVIKGALDSIGLDDQGRPEELELNGRDIEVSPQAVIAEVMALEGAVKIEGDFNQGVFLATSIESGLDSNGRQGRVEIDLQGAVTTIITDGDGNITEFVVEGNRLFLQALTLVDGVLERGLVVQVEGIVSEGQLLASRIKQIGEKPEASASNIP